MRIKVQCNAPNNWGWDYDKFDASYWEITPSGCLTIWRHTPGEVTKSPVKSYSSEHWVAVWGTEYR